MEMCKDTEKPTDTATLACLFSTFLDTTETETRGAKDGSWIWRLKQSIAARCTNFERMEEMCKDTDKPTDTATLPCLFSTFLGTTAAETRDAKDGSWIWRLKQSIAARCTNFERMEEMCKVTDKPTYTATLPCLFSTFLDTTETETRDAKDGSWIWRLKQSIAARCANFDKMEMCKVTKKPTDTATFDCLFSTSLDTTETKTRGAKDGS